MKQFSFINAFLVSLLLMVTFVSAQEKGDKQADEPPMMQVEKMLQQAREETNKFMKAGGKESDAQHPNRKWSAALWKFREQNNGTRAAAFSTAEAIHLLIHADGANEALTRADKLKLDDGAWEFLLHYLQEASKEADDYSIFNKKLQQLAKNSLNPSFAATANFYQGLSLKRSGENDKAKQLFKAALAGDLNPDLAEQVRMQLIDLESLNIGQTIPIFAAREVGGTPISISDYKGKVVLITFWSTTCPICVSEIPMLKNLQSQYADDGLVILGVSLDENAERLQKVISEKGITWTQLYDGKSNKGAVPRLFAVNGTPTHFIIDRGGKIAAKRVDGDELSKVILDILNK